MENTANPYFRIIIKNFKRYLENKGFRESTIEGYLGNISRYLEFCGTHKPSPQDISRFQGALHDLKLSRSTFNQYGYAIKANHTMFGEKVEFPRLNPNNNLRYPLSFQASLFRFAHPHLTSNVLQSFHLYQLI
jgi:hypothetical protein